MTPDRALDGLRAGVGAPPPARLPVGAPRHELLRTPAAARVGALAAADGLFCFHYEHRAWLSLPDDWLPADADPEADVTEWVEGVRAEPKYQQFRHDLMVASLHPGHRGKWTAHELCHRLVGYGWRAGASPLFHATAARLAELVPVMLWYFLDDAFVARCDRHQHGGGLFRDHCAACERVAAPTADDPLAVERVREGLRFFDAELAAIARTRRTGRPVANCYATLDLCSDGLAYAAAHNARLQSRTFHDYAERFLTPGAGWSATLDDLEARARAVVAAIVDPDARLEPQAKTPEAGADTWARQDVGWRLMQVQLDCEPECADAIEPIVLALAAGGAVADAREAWRALVEEWELPPVEVVFGVGYDIGGGLRCAEVAQAGVTSALPLTFADRAPDVSALLAADADAPSREHIGLRFVASFRDDPCAELARWEAIVASMPPGEAEDDALVGLSPDGWWRLARNARIERFEVDVFAQARRLAAGRGARSPTASERDPIEVGLVRRGAGDVTVVPLTSSERAALVALPEGGGALPCSARRLAALSEAGLILPARWPDP